MMLGKDDRIERRIRPGQGGGESSFRHPQGFPWSADIFLASKSDSRNYELVVSSVSAHLATLGIGVLHKGSAVQGSRPFRYWLPEPKTLVESVRQVTAN